MELWNGSTPEPVFKKCHFKGLKMLFPCKHAVEKQERFNVFTWKALLFKVES